MCFNKILQIHCGNENFTYLNGKNVLDPQIREIVWKFMEENIKNYKVLRLNLEKKSVIQYVYSKVFPYFDTMTEITM